MTFDGGAGADSISGIPEPTVFRDVTVGPMLRGSNKRILSFQVFPFDTPIRQLRRTKSGDLGDAALRSEMPEVELERAITLTEPTLYAGPYLRHFGHFVAECIHRLYARSQFEGLAHAKVAFHGIGWKANPIEPWLASVLDLCGVSLSEVVIIDRPMRFAELHVPVQARVLGGGNLIDGYADFFPPRDRRTSSDVNPASMVYLTRSRHLYSGSYLGETLVERILIEAGFTVISPEAISVVELVKKLRTAKFIIAGEGSAIHNLELCGKVEAGVLMIGRRKGTPDRFRSILDDVTRRWEIVEEILDSGVPLDWDAGMSRPSWQRACSILDLESVLRQIAEFTSLDLRIPSADEIKASIAADLAAYVLDDRSTRAETTNERLGELLRLLRKNWRAINQNIS